MSSVEKPETEFRRFSDKLLTVTVSLVAALVVTVWGITYKQTQSSLIEVARHVEEVAQRVEDEKKEGAKRLEVDRDRLNIVTSQLAASQSDIKNLSLRLLQVIDELKEMRKERQR